MWPARRATFILWCALIASRSVCQDAPALATLTRAQAAQRALELAAVGRKIFFDPSLSASGKLSCSSCHDPNHAYGPPNSASIQRGGKDLAQLGFRAAASLRYLQAVPAFTEHYFDSDGPDPSLDNGPTGGLAWDGRIDRGRDQARIPLLSPFEMANPSPADVVSKVRKAPYADEFERVAGTGSPADPEKAFAIVLEALETFEQDYREFYPYSSKYDAWLAGNAKLSGRELRGLKLFSDPAKGDCARCHPATRGVNGTPPQFTDYGFIALAVPRNRRIPTNSNPQWYDLGLCGPERKDLRTREEYCGQFRTPSLRNVALRGAFFHNGVFHSLTEAVEFYALRDAKPEKWYPRNADGSVMKFNDLPPKYWKNVETGPPFGQAPGAKPALSREEIGAVVAFLGTLTDGFQTAK
jgi:cytochrome c peroxidase